MYPTSKLSDARGGRVMSDNWACMCFLCGESLFLVSHPRYSQEGKSVYTSGVDQKVCQFSNVPVATATGNVPSSSSFHSKWVHTCSRRLHSHDVRCISTWPPYAPLTPSHRPPALSPGITPMLVSGGLDMSLVICPCALPSPDSNMVNPLKSGFVSTFEDGYHLRLPYTTGMSPAVQVSREAKLLLCRRNTNLTIWKIKQSVSPEEVGLTDIEVPVKDQGDNWEKLVDMELKTRTNLVASAIADDGSWVAASDLYETKLFRLIHAKVRAFDRFEGFCPLIFTFRTRCDQSGLNLPMQQTLLLQEQLPYCSLVIHLN